ncbi:hypothetical protein G7046_g3091 [Stylonectria norvegica]|nr:hypothetical protein G7046_g3091 [Stylonectria norvegica]
MAKFSTRLAGRHAIVTGGTKGIGRAIVEAFLSEGANVSYCARTVRGDEFKDFEHATDGARAVGASVDISDETAIQNWVEAAAGTFGQLDVVVANAASFQKEDNVESWKKSVQADVIGLVKLIAVSVPYLVKCEGTGSIVIISSLAGFEARSGNVSGPYGTVKRAQATLAKGYARELGPRGIRVNTIVPGCIEGPSLTLPDGSVQLSNFGMLKANKPEVYDFWVQQIPLGRTGTTEDLANAAVFLASSLSAFISGANLVVDGAMSYIT